MAPRGSDMASQGFRILLNQAVVLYYLFFILVIFGLFLLSRLIGKRARFSSLKLDLPERRK